MNLIFELLINLGIPLFLVALAMITGMIAEKKHFQSITTREKKFEQPVLNIKKYPEDKAVTKTRFVTGSVVISHDYFKRFLASLRGIFGGEVKSYVSLLDRGRREAILRLKEQCPDAEILINLRIETSSISKGGKKALGTVEVFAYATALWF